MASRTRPAQTVTRRASRNGRPLSITPAALVPRKRITVPQTVRTTIGRSRPQRGGSVGL